MTYPDADSRSARLFERAKVVMPGGTTRLTVFQTPYPIYAESGSGYRVTDVDGVTRIDCVNNMTSLLHGHRPPTIMGAVRRQLDKLVTVAAPTESEIELAEVLCSRVEGVEQIRFMNSGSEAVMFAIRAARAFTGRAKIAKTEGSYHGSYDPVATSVRADPSLWGNASTPVTVPDGAGISPGSVVEVVTLPFNNLHATRALLEHHGSELAAVIIDPLPSRLQFARADLDYIQMVRETCDRFSILLIFDEVMSFRLSYRGAQAEWGVVADITTLAKIIGGGFPIGAVGGRRDVMAIFDQLQGGEFVTHGGTFNASPLSMVAGVAAMAGWTPVEVDRLNGLGLRLREGMESILRATNLTGVVGGMGSLCFLGLGASGSPIRDVRDLVTRGFDKGLNTRFRIATLNAGVIFVDGGKFILSTAMDEAVIDEILDRLRFCLQDIAYAK